MKKISIFLAAFALMVGSQTACVRLGDLDLEPIPDISFTYECRGLTYTFTSADADDVHWNIVGEAEGSGDTFTYSFKKPGNYWVSMSGLYKGEQQTVSTKILVAKPSGVRLDDDTLNDWDFVTYPDFMLYGDDGESYGKFDYDANYLYFMFVLKEQDMFNIDEAIWNLRLDADDNSQTGYSTKSLGCEWYYEGNCCGEEPWDDWYIGRKDEDLEWTDTVKEVMGTCGTTDDGKFFFELGISRKAFGIKTAAVAFFTKFYNEDWDDAVAFKDKDGNASIHLALDKE